MANFKFRSHDYQLCDHFKSHVALIIGIPHLFPLLIAELVVSTAYVYTGALSVRCDCRHSTILLLVVFLNGRVDTYSQTCTFLVDIRVEQK